MALTGMESYDWGQGQGSLYDRIVQDNLLAQNAKPRVPPNPTLASSTFILADGTTASDVTVSWTPVRKNIDYIIRWKKTSDANYTYARVRTSPHVIRPIDAASAVTVALAAERRVSGARSRFSGDVSITTGSDTTPPGAPTLTLTVNNISGVISLTWTPSTAADLAYYVLSRNTSTGPTGEYQRTPATAFDDTAVTQGTTYFYRVRAVDRSGNQSAYSNEVNGAVAFVGSFPIAPQMGCACDPPNTYQAIISVPTTIPAGSRFLNCQVSLTSNTLIAAPNNVNVRFSVDTAGTDSSNVVNLSFSAGGQTRYAVLKSTVALSSTGSRTLLFEWQDGSNNTATYQLTSPGSVQVTVS